MAKSECQDCSAPVKRDGDRCGACRVKKKRRARARTAARVEGALLLLHRNRRMVEEGVTEQDIAETMPERPGLEL